MRIIREMRYSSIYFKQYENLKKMNRSNKYIQIIKYFFRVPDVSIELLVLKSIEATYSNIFFTKCTHSQ